MLARIPAVLDWWVEVRTRVRVSGLLILVRMWAVRDSAAAVPKPAPGTMLIPVCCAVSFSAQAWRKVAASLERSR